MDSEQSLESALDKLDSKRLVYLNDYKTRLKMSSLIALNIVIFGWLFSFIDSVSIFYAKVFSLLFSEFGIVAITLVIGAIYHYITTPVRAYKHSYKSIVIPALMSGHDGVKFYGDKARPRYNLLRSLSILPSYTIAEGEDYISWSKNGIESGFHELELKTKSDKRYRTCFKGAIMYMELPIKFNHRLIISKDSGAILNSLSSVFTKGSKVALENVKFENNFEVHCDDDLFARYVLNPSIMEKSLQLLDIVKNNFNGKSLRCEFFNNNIVFALEYSKDLLEAPSIYKKSTDQGNLQDVAKELEIILSIPECIDIHGLVERNMATSKVLDSQ